MSKTINDIRFIGGLGLLLVGIMIILVIEVKERGGEKGRKREKKEGIISTLMFSYATILGLKGELKGVVKAIHPKSKEQLNRSIIKGSYEFETIPTDILKGSGDLFSLNEESIVNLKPEVILTWNNMMTKKKNRYEKLGIKVEIFEYSHKEEEVLKWLKKIAEVVGEEKRYEEYKRYREEKKEEIKKRLNRKKREERLKGLYFYSYKELKVCGKYSYQQTHFDILNIENGVNKIYKGNNGLPNINIEMIVMMDPDIILIRPLDEIKLEAIMRDKRLKGIKAIKEKRVYRVPLGGYDWSAPGLENPLLWLWLGKLIYPEEMKGIDLKEEIKEKLKWMYTKLKLDEEMLKKILNQKENKKMKSYKEIMS